MKPYDEKFIIDKIKEYSSQIQVNEIGKYKIMKRDGLKGIIDGYLYEREGEVNTEIPELVGEERIWMRICPKEIQGSYEFIKLAKGKVGIVGLGLGYIVQEISKKDEVEEIIVYEISQDVIDLYNSNFQNNKKIKIIHGDAFKVKGEKFDLFFSDIYEYKLSLKVVEDYIELNKIHNIEQYLFFGLEHFLLSCSYDEIVWVYLPEPWMDMSKRISNRLDDSGYIKYYKKLDEKLVSEVLEAFKVIFNENEEEE
ncbi:hypothetical protein [Clostridium vincentii]|uniref:Spermidine synthase n=1 Tax=Clostridium vincentii TaxID=52704 RepID=A0A2T0BGM4_9CLOT|nr:hypothetical protein [Clostridium vincentii]PRR83019.1 hypothetical protein CLVI_12680 [Clostridium vincentii]